MSYIHIENAFRYPDIFLFREVYATEKIHGTTSHISWNPEDKKLNVHAGAGAHKDVCAFLKLDALKERFAAKFLINKVTVYGETYGGKLQHMFETYGDVVRFVAFDVMINGRWCSVPEAEKVVVDLGLEFVHYDKTECTIEKLNAFMNAPSVQAVRNGIVGDKAREGIVVRPLVELTKSNGDRIICKHRRPEFRETKSERELREIADVDPAKFAILEKAQEIADEYVTERRFSHVFEKLGILAPTIKDSRVIIEAMLADIKRESSGEVVWSKEAEASVGRSTAALFKEFLKTKQKNKSSAVSGVGE